MVRSATCRALRALNLELQNSIDSSITTTVILTREHVTKRDGGGKLVRGRWRYYRYYYSIDTTTVVLYVSHGSCFGDKTTKPSVECFGRQKGCMQYLYSHEEVPFRRFCAREQIAYTQQKAKTGKTDTYRTAYRTASAGPPEHETKC